MRESVRKKIIIFLIISAILPAISFGNEDFPDLLTIDHLCTFKCRAQDVGASVSKNEVMEKLLQKGKFCIPYLIDRLESKRKAKPAVLDYWPYVKNGIWPCKYLPIFFLTQNGRNQRSLDCAINLF
jgi:hypothetical protein